MPGQIEEQSEASRLATEAARALNRKRWEKIPVEERKNHVPHNGGARRKYPQCTYYKRQHQFVNDVCMCGFVRDKSR